MCIEFVLGMQRVNSCLEDSPCTMRNLTMVCMFPSHNLCTPRRLALYIQQYMCIDFVKGNQDLNMSLGKDNLSKPRILLYFCICPQHKPCTFRRWVLNIHSHIDIVLILTTRLETMRKVDSLNKKKMKWPRLL